ncbi:WD40 repeat domain-containing serine/threonine protein kinase [Tuwongella immobilis]|uniref:non-specific serine/threonine protein kinase n=1 Tax=Tuwongella immobilis TaxID=692036 RepID=A0A6C2YSY6_9BACT|nr:serine/threonine-protein kinase [Tuwongella immobilis]VIP04045.1 wd40 repeat-containing protein : Uncultured bacterium genome assembly Metasoil_fosmids_resub OS=uncultured bacterium PE=4 SV=1: Pkinase: WD40: WD40: WD40: WD40: WD40: WD40: WD40: WD40 [Tuwongella immobilis]VTS05457.1 wd40 repeat-containing protein : Uncultured bacterium genome assembly Metasoil_fosmids_resub OS=uncultured bacterium PE=4 SV=1: Pkinase: WD40: WD40: WD40: WD40: WD40: WD40: WD40: WD40 [Tuwongella immobilis]
MTAKRQNPWDGATTVDRFGESALYESATSPNIDGYELLDVLGRGGMGVVYRARQVQLDRQVALKVILNGAHAEPMQRERFQREAMTVAALSHPNIIRIYEVGEYSGLPYLALELVEGGSLADRLDGTPWPAKPAAKLIETLARAMHHAHEEGIVHRDLKPANILLQSSLPGSANRSAQESVTLSAKSLDDQPKITDFGLAKRFDATLEDSPRPGTHTGAVLGTPNYMSPEQASGHHREHGPHSDIYSLGAILYELLTGRPPFAGESAVETIMQVMMGDALPPRMLHPRLARDLDTICLKCLQKDPRKRYSSAAELADDLARFQAGKPILARPIGRIERTMKWAKRHPAIAVSSVLGTLVLLGALALTLWVNVELRQANDREQARANQARQAQDAAVRASHEAESRRLEAEQARKAAEDQSQIAREEATKSRRSLFALQLAQIAALHDRDSGLALEWLNDPRRCPPDLRDFTWHYWQARCQRKLAECIGHTGPVNGVQILPGERGMLSISWDGTARLWDMRGQCHAIFQGHDGLVLALAVSGDGWSFVTGGEDRTVMLWSIPLSLRQNLRDGIRPNGAIPVVRPLAIGRGHRDMVRAVVVDRQVPQVLSTGADGTVQLWRLPAYLESSQLGESSLLAGAVTGMLGYQRLPLEWHPIQTVLQGLPRVWAMDLSRDGQLLLLGCDDRQARVYQRVPKGFVLHRSLMHEFPVQGAAFTPDGQTIATFAQSGSTAIWLWNTADGQRLRTLTGHVGPIVSMSFSGSGKWLASGSFDRTLRIWEVDSGRERSMIRGHGERLRSVAFSPEQNRVVTGGMDHRICLWQPLASDVDPTQLPGGGERTVAIVDGSQRWIMTARPNGMVDLVGLDWDGRSLQRTPHPYAKALLLGHTGPVNALAVHPNHRWAATAGQDGLIRIWDLANLQPGPPERIATLRPVRQLRMEGGVIRDLRFAQDGEWLWAAGDGGVSRWKVGGQVNGWQPTPLATPIVGRVKGVQLIPGPTPRLAIITDRSVRVHDSATGEMLTESLSPGDGELTALTVIHHQILTGDADGKMIRWEWAENPNRLTAKLEMTGHGEAIVQLLPSLDGETVISASRDRTVRCWDLVIGLERGEFSGHTEGVLAVGWLPMPDGSLGLLSLGRDGSLRFWPGMTGMAGPVVLP